MCEFESRILLLVNQKESVNTNRQESTPSTRGTLRVGRTWSSDPTRTTVPLSFPCVPVHLCVFWRVPDRNFNGTTKYDNQLCLMYRVRLQFRGGEVTSLETLVHSFTYLRSYLLLNPGYYVIYIFPDGVTNRMSFTNYCK